MHSSVSGHLGCFHILAIVNNAAISIVVHIFFKTLISVLWYIYPRVGLLDHMVITHMEPQKILNSQSNLEKEQNWKHLNS